MNTGADFLNALVVGALIVIAIATLMPCVDGYGVCPL